MKRGDDEWRSLERDIVVKYAALKSCAQRQVRGILYAVKRRCKFRSPGLCLPLIERELLYMVEHVYRQKAISRHGGVTLKRLA